MRKRTWVYCQPPQSYEISCDKCGGQNIAWSEYEGHIWCFTCSKDTKGSLSIFDGPIPVEACKLFGISFDRIDLKTGDRLYMTLTKKGDRIIYRRKKGKTNASS